jgi:hypothetical protein
VGREKIFSPGPEPAVGGHVGPRSKPGHRSEMLASNRLGGKITFENVKKKLCYLLN